MNRTLLGRIMKVEAAKAPPKWRIAIVPPDAYEHGPEHSAAVEAEVVRDYQARTGYRPTVLVLTGVPR
jgi:hypothetical protein